MPRTTSADGHTWNTASEIEFINKLEPKALRKYAEGLSRRTRWDRLDAREVKRAVERRLQILGPPAHKDVLPTSM